MSTFKDDIRNAASQAGLDIQTELGDTLSYTCRDGTNLTVASWECGLETKELVRDSGMDIEKTTRDFSIAFQPDVIGIQGPQGPQGFPVVNTTAPSIGDVLVYNSLTYFVDRTRNDAVGAVYGITASRNQAIRLGVE